MNLRNIHKTTSFILAGTITLLLSACGAEDTHSHEGAEISTARVRTIMATTDSRDHAKKVAVEVTASGYHPGTVMATAGEPITIVFTRTTEEGCGQKVLIPSEGIEEDLPLNTPVEITFTPGESGNFGFTCGMKMMKGTIMVH